MNQIKELQALLDEVESLKRKGERARGAIEEMMRSLKERFSCKDLKSAERLLKKLQEEEKQEEERLGKLHQEFLDKYGEFLET
jgi:hypothetical protein